jgi:hypothetical protein
VFDAVSPAMRVTLMTITITKAWIAMLQMLAAAPTRY